MNDTPTPEAISSAPSLRRSLGPVTLMFYGVGGMLGAGIYALIGNAAAQLGNAVWMAFGVSMIAALLTGLSYACIGSRYPRAAGAAYATLRGYRSSALSYIVGLCVVASGLTSMATGARAIGREFGRLGFAVSPELVAIVYLVILAGVVFWGIRESMAINITFTSIEVIGLLFIIVIGVGYIGSADLLAPAPATQPGDSIRELSFALVVSGAVLTFFSFIGFEDILNVAEETKNPRRDIPIGLIGAMLIATTIYMLVAIIAVSAVPHAQLVEGGLREVVRVAAPWCPPEVFSYVLIFAVANTALLNFIMASRLIYGMSSTGLLPRSLGRVHVKRRTPYVAILVLLAIIVTLMLIGHIDELAAATTLLLLTVFSVVNVALVILKLRPSEPRGGFEVPAIVPLLGAVVCAGLVVTRLLHPPANSENAPLIAGAIIAIATILYAVMSPKAVEA